MLPKIPLMVSLKTRQNRDPNDFAVQSFDSAAFGDGAVLGCDFVGKVVEVGKNVHKLAIDDNVAGLIWGGKSQTTVLILAHLYAGEIKGLGAYSHYTLADDNISFKIPSGLSPDSASTIPLALNTAWLALFSKGCLNIDRTQPQSVLIWGGSCK